MSRKFFFMLLFFVCILPVFSQTTGKCQLLFLSINGHEVTSSYREPVDYARQGAVEEIHVRNKFDMYKFDFFHFQPGRNNYDFYGVLKTASPEIEINGTAIKNSTVYYTEWILNCFHEGQQFQLIIRYRN